VLGSTAATAKAIQPFVLPIGRVGDRSALAFERPATNAKIPKAGRRTDVMSPRIGGSRRISRARDFTSEGEGPPHVLHGAVDGAVEAR